MGDRLVLVGAAQGKRTEYFLRAAHSLGCIAEVFSYAEYPMHSRVGDRVKLDPPPIHESELAYLDKFTDWYQQALAQIERLEGIRFLNHPSEIWAALDKCATKIRLLQNGVPTPAYYPKGASSYEQLRALMEQEHVYRVFIKPRYGSGAAGVAAFCIQPKNGRELLYTALQLEDGRLFNTKRVVKSSNVTENRLLLDLLLSQQTIVEQWQPKDVLSDGITYDLRAVCQQGELRFLVPRGAHSPITNLHLNDMALDLEQLQISPELAAQIQDCCRQAARCFPGLHTVGLDLLIPPRNNGAIRPMVIEVNGQGDLIYKDIFAHNTIYQKQVEYLIELEKETIENEP